MKIRVTQTDIARVAGVHNTTVSLSLRNSRLIPDETRKRIQAIAMEMGYCPDPALRALVAYRNSRRSKRELGTLAYVTNWDSKFGWRDLPGHAQYFAGAQRKAAEAGYQLEHLWLGEPGMTQRRLGDMLVHRGISGVLLASHRSACDNLSGLEWPRFSVIKIGAHPHAPAAHRVTEDYGDALRLAMRQVAGAGYRRVGFVLSAECDDATDQAWSTGFFAEQSRHRARDRVPLFLLRNATPLLPGEFRPAAAEEALALEDWYQEHRPDVILGLGPEIPARLEQLGLAVPDDAAYIDLALHKPEGQLAGVQPNCERVGELAVELLAAQLLQNNFGLPALPTVTSVSGTWCPGGSLPIAAESRRSELSRGTPVRCA